MPEGGLAIPLPVFAAAAFLLAGVVKGVIGMGLPTLSMGLLGLLISPAQAASILVAPSLLTNVWQFLSGSQRKAVFMRLAPMMLAMALGTWFGTRFMVGAHQHEVSIGLGVVLIVYALHAQFAPPLRLPGGRESWWSPPMGLATGVVAGATGLMTLPGLPYLQVLGFEREALIQALGLMFTTGSLALGVSLWSSAAHWPTLPMQVWTTAVPSACVAAVVGMAIGQRLRPRLSSVLFRRVFMNSLIVIGAAMIIKNIW